MQIKIRSTNFDITPAIEQYLYKKISSLEKFIGGREQVLCEVEIGRTTRRHKSGDIFRAEVNIIEPGNKQIYAVAEEGDLYSAVDIVRDEAEREIVSRKNKRHALFRRGGAQIKKLLKMMNLRPKRW